jgi:hypothetical protein
MVVGNYIMLSLSLISGSHTNGTALTINVLHIEFLVLGQKSKLKILLTVIHFLDFIVSR